MKRQRWVIVGIAGAISSAAIAQGQQQGQQAKLNALLGAPRFGASVTFPTPPKARIYGGTENIRWISEVEAMLEAKAQQMPAASRPAPAKLSLCFKLDAGGQPFGVRLCDATGNRPLEAFVRRVLATAAPFPPPPTAEMGRELRWVYASGREPKAR